PKLRGIHETVRRTQICVIERVEKFAAELELRSFSEHEVARKREIERLHARTVNGIAPDVAKSKCRRSGKGSSIHPLACRASPGAKYRLAGVVSTIGIFAQGSAGVCRISENRNGERKPCLHLINGGKLPVLRNSACYAEVADPGQIVNGAESKSVADVATRP